ncbi:hypothetical protein [Plantactinospora sp. WMMB782]|uniref:hypothetical protein n=1 Tax=Plantactinospora sp. WMMB782 TaxID=3404121 RepID=UPI003B930DEE
MAATGGSPRPGHFPDEESVSYPTATASQVAGRRPHGDRISGGPVWGGFVVALAVWITLEVFFVAVGATDVGGGDGSGPNSAAWWWSLVAAAVGLFVGGMTAGAAALWRGISDGLLVGVTLWGLTVVAVLILASIGTGIGFGAFGEVYGVRGGAGSGQAVPADVTDSVREAAAVALLVLGVTVAAAAAGSVVGAKVWPRRADRMTDATR